jgi:hypothetical protein
LFLLLMIRLDEGIDRFAGKLDEPILGLLPPSARCCDLAFNRVRIGQAFLRTPGGIDLPNAPDCFLSLHLLGGEPRLLVWRAFRITADAAAAARHLRDTRAFAATSRAGPLAAVGIAARYARLVGIEIGFDRALEIAELLLARRSERMARSRALTCQLALVSRTDRS